MSQVNLIYYHLNLAVPAALVSASENVGPPQVTQRNDNVTETADTDPPAAMASAPPADQVVPTLPVSEGEEVEAAEVQEGADAVSSV